MNFERLKMIVIILLPWAVFPWVQSAGYFDLRFWLDPSPWVRAGKLLVIMIYLFGCCALTVYLLFWKWYDELILPIEEGLKQPIIAIGDSFRRKKKVIATNSGTVRTIVAIVFLPSYLLAIAASILIHIPIYNWLVSLKGKEAISNGEKYLYIGIAVICGIVTIFLVIRSFCRQTMRSHSILLLPDDCPQLYQMVYRICQHIGASPPNQIVLEYSANFYVTEFKIMNFKHMMKNRTLSISAPLLLILTPEEFIAVVTHEMAHFSGKDTLYGKLFYPVYRGVESSLGSYVATLQVVANYLGSLGVVTFALIAPFLLLYLFYFSFKFMKSGIDRQRELRADRIAATLVGPEVMGRALIKVGIGANVWAKDYAEWVKHIAARETNSGALGNFISHMPKTREEMYAVLTNGKNPVQKFDARDEYKSRPFDSHPTIHQRMSTLGLSQWDSQLYQDDEMKGSVQMDLDLQPSSNARSLVPGHHLKYAELSRLEEDFLKKRYAP